MSTSEDSELQDLVKQTLETNGSLSKIRAELRANIFLALDENGCVQGTNSKNLALQNFSQSADGNLVLCLIQEFLECYGLSFTMSVLDPELASCNVRCSWKSRTELMKQLNLTADSDNEKKPLMYHILQQLRRKQHHVPGPITSDHNDQKANSGSTSDRLMTCPMECSDAPVVTVNLTQTISEEKREHSSEPPSKVLLKSENSEWMGHVKSPTNGRDSFASDLSKSNASLLGDLPPLSPTTNSSKTSVNTSNKSLKQMSKLKAMLIDSYHETTDVSNITDDEFINSIDQDDNSDMDNLDEKQIQELLKE